MRVPETWVPDYSPTLVRILLAAFAMILKAPAFSAAAIVFARRLRLMFRAGSTYATV